MTVRELGERMDSAEISEWLAFDRLEPLPDPYYAAGIVAASNAAIWGGKGKALDPAYYLPTKVKASDPSKPRQSPKAMFGVFKRAIDASSRKGT